MPYNVHAVIGSFSKDGGNATCEPSQNISLTREDGSESMLCSHGIREENRI